MSVGSCCKGYSFLIFLILGVVFLLGSVGLDLLISSKIRDQLSQRLVLLNGTEFYAKWSKPPVPLFSRYYIFDVQNPAEVLSGKEAILKEVGPFTFEKKMTRDIKGFSEDGLEVNVITKSHMYFRPELSDMEAFQRNITIFNVPLAIVASMWVKRAEKSWASGIQINMLKNTIENNRDQLFMQTTAKTMLIDGYFVGTMKAAQAAQAAQDEGEEEGNEPTGMYSMMARRNGSDRGLWTMNTGKDSMSKTGTIKTWNGMTSFSCWSGSSCNEIKGSEGAFFPPPISAKKPLYLFSPDMNGSIAAHYSHDVEVDGLTKMRFRVLEEAIRAPLDHEENSCFCVKEEPKEKDKFCHLDGIIDISGCHSGVPIALSKPHFFKGSPLLRSHFKGLEPNREKHESYFDIDPNLGLVSKAMVRMQLNIDLTKLKQISTYARITHMFFPNHWSEDSFTLEGEFLKPLYEFKAVKGKTTAIINGAVIGGVIFVVLGCVIMYFTAKFRKEVIKFSPQAKFDQKEGVLTSFLPDYPSKNGKTKEPVKSNGVHRTNEEEAHLNNNDAIVRD